MTDIGFVDRLHTLTAAGLASDIAEMIRSGELPHGTRLPTIRAVSEAVGVSVGTVAEAWASLRQDGLVETRRRGGTRVIAQRAARSFTSWADVDLLLSSPDTALQPPLEAALLQGLRQQGVNAWGREHMVPPLREAVTPMWPFAAEAWMTAGGGTEGLWLATRAAIRPGRPIAIEEPAPPGFLSTVHDMGVEVIGVPADEEGPLPGALQSALDAGASAVVIQPGGPFATRSVLSEERAAELAALLSPTGAVVVEDDSLGPLSAVPVRTIGSFLPDRTIRVLSFCKAFGLDLRTSVIGGARVLIDQAIAARSGGLASTSRILQHALAALLLDSTALDAVAEAKSRYARRREMALAAFTSEGLTAHSGTGSLTLWAEVEDERAAALALAARGVVVDVGATAFVSPQSTGLLRLSTAQLPEDAALLDELARLVAQAASGALRVPFG